MPTFTATLFKVPGKGGWTFAPIPDEHIPEHAGAFGMTPVQASVDGRRWPTTIWRDKTHGALLPVPERVRGGKGHGDAVEVWFELDPARAAGAR